MKKSVWLMVLIIGFCVGIVAGDWEIAPEQTNYTRTSTYREVLDLVFAAQTRSNKINVLKLTDSYEGRMIPLVVISSEGIKSPRELALTGKPAVLIMANIHAGEVEGKEASLMLIRDIVNNKDLQLLENQVLLLLPIFNADGNDKFGKNRRDNGPEEAGVRYNGQFLDLNRDYLKIESPEVKGLVTLFNQWDPVLIVDLHTTNGSYHREPVTYSTLSHANGDAVITAYMWEKFFPAVAKTLKSTYGWDSIPYGNFVDRLKPETGWENDALLARFGTNYAGLRNRFTVLNENYSYADFKTRVLGCYGFVKSILRYTHDHIREMQEMVKAADARTKNSYYKENFALEYKVEKLFDVTIKSYEFTIEKIKPEDQDKYPFWIKDFIAQKTDVFKDYTVPYYGRVVSTRTIPLPKAYILLPNHPEIVEILKSHGIIPERVRKTFQANLDAFKMEEIKPARRLYQGHINIKIKGHYETQTLTIPEGSYYISLEQPLARLVPLLLEPECEDGLASWGFFNRELISQWTGVLQVYPVYRCPAADIAIERYQE